MRTDRGQTEDTVRTDRGQSEDRQRTGRGHSEDRQRDSPNSLARPALSAGESFSSLVILPSAVSI